MVHRTFNFPTALVVLVVMGATIGCASGARSPLQRKAKETFPRQPIALNEELEAELRDVALDFVISVPDNRYAWERAQLFFKEHTSGTKFSAGQGDAIKLSNSSATDPVSYTVEKVTVQDGSRFRLQCAAGARPLPPDIVTTQCKNLARFIHFGILEQSLLIR